MRYLTRSLGPGPFKSVSQWAIVSSQHIFSWLAYFSASWWWKQSHNFCAFLTVYWSWLQNLFDSFVEEEQSSYNDECLQRWGLIEDVHELLSVGGSGLTRVQLDQWFVSCRTPNCPGGNPCPYLSWLLRATETIPPPNLTHPWIQITHERKDWKYQQQQTSPQAKRHKLALLSLFYLLQLLQGVFFNWDPPKLCQKMC